ncbi:IclR family transcriptional regulator [Ammoniphilus sp. YIM 78166]|uniref:IclR family transcriptional regulator n=1 Tax=Ammoniphilus sp. YIM 78166 TaxID=1644106 RepID=UPI00106FDB0C|nr:IclR family transcriptional regulator [Ammoniphilus sp. YIM 78166]
MSETIRKSVKIWTCLMTKKDKVEWSATDISRELDIPVQTVHRLLSSLEESGMVFKDWETKKYRLGLNLIRMGFSLRNELLARNSAIPIMERLANKTNGCVYLTFPEGDEGVLIEYIHAKQRDLKMEECIGMRAPLCIGASQKVILAFMNQRSQHKITKILNEKGKIHDLQLLKKELQTIRGAGLALSFGEMMEGSARIAFPVFSWQDQVVASITVKGSEAIFSGSRLEEIVNSAQKAADELSGELGWVKKASEFSN